MDSSSRYINRSCKMRYLLVKTTHGREPILNTERLNYKLG
jgi:hypothetical protein